MATQVRTEDLDNEELISQFRQITGESAADCLEMAGKAINKRNLVCLLHNTIIYANEVGQPGEQLTETMQSGSAAIVNDNQTRGASTSAHERETEKNNKKDKNIHEDEILSRIADLEKATESVESLKDKNVHMELEDIDERIQYLDNIKNSSAYVKKRKNVKMMLEQFLQKIPGSPTFLSITPHDIKRFLVWKDRFGKTTVHSYKCKQLGITGDSTCKCPKRLAAASVRNIIQHLVDILELEGRGRAYDEYCGVGNPAASVQIKGYLKCVQEEQAKAHILPKQAKPFFLTKLETISKFISRELGRSDLTLKERFVLIRDQALFKLQFFAGDRASDIAITLLQEVKYLRKKDGFAFNHTFGKTLRGNGKTNTFVIKCCPNETICPVRGLERYFAEAKRLGIDMSSGYLFRMVTESGRVINEPMSYSSIYERLKCYLITLGIDEGETPHSLRAGCAVHMCFSNAAHDVHDLMNHVGWATESSAKYYSRYDTLLDASNTAVRLAQSSERAKEIEIMFHEKANFGELPSITTE
nr:uncharacterized protein LOC117691581 [Crassostrea gigas]